MIEIRRMRPEDAEAAARLEAVCFSHPWSAKAFAQCAADENVCYLMAWEGEKLVGNCGVRNIAGDGEITNVAVDPACRRQRVGTELMNKLLETGRSMGIEAFTLEVRASNQAAIRLYESFGFLLEGTRRNFYEDPREDALIYWKR
ncbi:MAG: ribosomal protein S18-alanine N-acetyltransferase [Lachnospiraceae bacterium]|nr:ribosomal protein S18-alanine N-acetyltransferase [Lachnospiraceae bacterium]